MGVISELGDMAWKIIERIPGCDRNVRDTSCLFFATAAASALRGTDWNFSAGGAMLSSSIASGWGLSVSPADQSYVCYASKEVDAEDGSYVGHCWVEAGPQCGRYIVDIMEGYYGPRTDVTRLIVYHRIPSLGRSIKAYYRSRLTAIAKAARKDAEFVRVVSAAAERAQKKTWP